MLREIVSIDQEKCDGCGLCVPACHEGAIRIVNGKAQLAAERLCDGLGACLGHCPRGAIRIEKREADRFDEQAVAAHLQAVIPPTGSVATGPRSGMTVMSKPSQATGQAGGGGCPSQRFARLGRPAAAACSGSPPDSTECADGSELAQWPVQLRLLPPRAAVFQDADLLLTADCAPVALADYQRLLRGRAVAIACPKLDDTSTYVPKLAEIIAANSLRRLTVVHMEVPCCTGLLMMAAQAREAAGVDVPIEEIIVGIRGDILQRRMLPGLATSH